MLHSSGVVHMSQEVAALVFKFNPCLLPSLFFHQPHRFAIWNPDLMRITTNPSRSAMALNK
jgi:hypothetical protein